MAQAKRVKNSTDLSVSIVIPTKNRPKELLACIDSLSKQSTKPLEIVIIDQSKTDDCRETVNSALRNSGIKLLYIWNNKLPGLTHARNLGVKKCSGNIILFLDDDVILHKNYIKYVLDVYNADKDGVIGGVEGLVQSESQSKKSKLEKIGYYLFCLGVFRGQREEFYWSPPRLIVPVRELRGCNMSFRTEIFDKFSFDENFTGYSLGEDRDFSLRVATKYKLILAPNAMLVHKESSATRSTPVKKYSDKVFVKYYIFKKDTPKNIRNWIYYLWWNFGIVLKAIMMHGLHGVRGTFLGYLRICKTLLKVSDIVDKLRDI